MRKSLVFAVLLLALSFNASAALSCGDSTGSATWSVGQTTLAFDALGVDNEVWCMAYGKELHYVQTNFPGIRWRSGASVMFWSGDDAAFIIENL